MPALVIDSREQTPFAFGPTVQTIRAGLPVGDYSLVGAETLVAIERKSLADFVQSVTHERARFWRELERLGAYDFAAVIIEASTADLWAEAYVSRATPWSVLASALAISSDFGLPVIWAGDRETAARCTFWLLRRYAEKQVTQ